MAKYQKYQHLEKFGSDEVDGILLGECYIFPKIDGTNVHIWRERGKIKAGSRNRELTTINDDSGLCELTTENDNAGFCKWVESNNDSLNNLFCFLPEGSRIFGEWLVRHSLKTYREDAWRRFYIFDVYIPSEDRYMKYDEYFPIIDAHKHFDAQDSYRRGISV